MHDTTTQVLSLFEAHGKSRYGHEAVSQLQHALQAASQAEAAGADAELIAAALLHDIGHLLHDLPEDAPDHGIDDRHEMLGERWLEKHFSSSVVDPVRLHVEAKRYLCASEEGYLDLLSEPSRQSLMLQGGPMNAAEIKAFESHPHHQRAVRLRRWDDQAKDPTLVTRGIDHFAKYLDQAAKGAAKTA
jgi:[1-hydroxy-2-(trimethylamino)ethyl]phosphonate dioxygenase